MVQSCPVTFLLVLGLPKVILQACPPEIVRTFVLALESSFTSGEFVRTTMLPPDTRIGEGRGATGLCIGLRGHALQPDRPIAVQTGRIRPAYCRRPRVFGSCVFRIFLLLSLIGGNHTQKGRPEPLESCSKVGRLKGPPAPTTLDCFQLPLGSQSKPQSCVSIPKRLARAGLQGLCLPVRVRQLG